MVYAERRAFHQGPRPGNGIVESRHDRAIILTPGSRAERSPYEYFLMRHARIVAPPPLARNAARRPMLSARP
jgi:hypothetical protein